MAASTPVGQVLRDAEGVRLEFVRSVAAPVEAVWAAVADPDRLAQWFGRWSGDPATGAVQLVMSAEGGSTPERVVVDACEPPRRLAVTLPGPEGDWPLVLELDERGPATQLRLVHRLAEPYDASSIGPGWQFYLDRLQAVVAGTPVPESFDDYVPALAPAYALPPA